LLLNFEEIPHPHDSNGYIQCIKNDLHWIPNTK
jgi:hypothetical protein